MKARSRASLTPQRDRIKIISEARKAKIPLNPREKNCSVFRERFLHIHGDVKVNLRFRFSRRAFGRSPADSLISL